MTVESIVTRKPDEQGRIRISVESMAFVVQEYIKEVKGEKVVINLEKRLNRAFRSDFEYFYRRQLSKIIDAYGFAAEYFCEQYIDNHQNSNNVVKTA